MQESIFEHFSAQDVFVQVLHIKFVQLANAQARHKSHRMISATCSADQ